MSPLKSFRVTLHYSCMYAVGVEAQDSHGAEQIVTYLWANRRHYDPFSLVAASATVDEVEDLGAEEVA